MKRIVTLVLLLLAASVVDVRATESAPTIIGNDRPDDCSSAFGSVEFDGLTPDMVALVDPERVYTADGEYPLPAGTYIATVFIPGGPLLAELTWTIRTCPQWRVSPRPRRVAAAAPLPTLPPTDTAGDVIP
jgi:hypothetical protein